MVEVLCLGKKIDLEEFELEFGKNRNGFYIKVDKGNEIYLDEYKKDKNYFKVNLMIKSNYIEFLGGNDIYIYDFNEIYLKDKIFGKHKFIYIGLNLKEEKRFNLIREKLYLLSPFNKIEVGGGIVKVVDSEIIKEEEVAKQILKITDGILVRRVIF